MRKIVGTSVVVGVAAVVLIVCATVSMAQERATRGPGMRGFGGRGPGMAGPPGLLQSFDRVDKNSDGKLAKDEVTDWMWARISRLDADSDGALSRQELESTPGPRGEGRSSRGTRPGGRGQPGRGEAGGVSFDSKTLPKNDGEKKILAVLDDMDKNQRRGMMNVPVQDGRLLRLLAETAGAKHVVEIGTSNGYSGIWFCLALRNTGGKLTTYEIDERRAGLARENFKRAGVDKLVTLVEGDAHEEVTKLKGPIDLLFLDADKEGYIDYLNKLLPLVRPGGLIVAHNMNPRQADAKFVKAITTNADLETLFLHMQTSGVSVAVKKH